MSQLTHQVAGPETDEIATDLQLSGELRTTQVQRSRPLWRNRDYILLWSGQVISSIGSQVSQMAFPLLVLAITFSPAQAGIVGALRGLPFALLCLPAGALLDRWNRKKVMLFCDLGRALALASIPLALWLGELSFLQLCLVAVIEGTLMTFFSIAELTCLPHVVAKEQLPVASAQNQLIETTSWTIGPFLGGLLYGLGRALPFLLDALSYACSVMGLCFIKAHFQEERTTAPRKIWLEIGEGLLWLWHEPVLRFLSLLACGLIAPSIGFSLILITLAQSQHASPMVIGLLFAGGGFGSILGSFLTNPLQKRFTVGQLTIGSAWVWAVSWLLLAIAPNTLVLGIVNALTFIIVPIYMSVQFSYRLIVIPDELQGRVQSIYRLLSFGSQPLGLALTGFLIQWLGPIWTVIVLFFPQGLFALLATFYRPLRETPSLSELSKK